MTKLLHLECLSGIAGDMTLAALIDAGVDVQLIRAGIDSMGLPDVQLHVEPVKKHGFAALHLKITHPEQKAHRHLHHIEAMIDGAGEITESAKTLAKRIFHTIATAEAKVHGSTLQKVHFHEVGAIDSIVDIVGVAIAIDDLKPDRITASAIPTGTGSITIDHGRVPVPAPATIHILCGVPIAASDIEAELTTPTGAAIVKTLCDGFGPMPAMTPSAIGLGAGTMDLPGQANVLRVVLGVDQPAGTRDRVVQIDSNIDDATPQDLAAAAETLIDAGALDVWQTPVTMKKGRAAVTLSVLAAPESADALSHLMLLHTPAIGVRRHVCDRVKLPRRAVSVDTRFGPIAGKVVDLPGGGQRFAPEDDSVRGHASIDVTVAEVRVASVAAWSRPA